jgi:hypothetical protein
MQQIDTRRIAEQRCVAQILRLQLAHTPAEQRSELQRCIALAEHEFQRLERAFAFAPTRR